MNAIGMAGVQSVAMLVGSATIAIIFYYVAYAQMAVLSPGYLQNWSPYLLFCSETCSGAVN